MIQFKIMQKLHHGPIKNKTKDPKTTNLSAFVYAMSSVVLISDLLYQSAAIVFLDGGRVSEGLVMVSLAFHLFVVGTVIFASVLLCQVKSLFLERKMCTYVKD